MRTLSGFSGALALALMMVIAAGCSSQRELTPATHTLIGVLHVTGNEPFTNLSLQTTDGRMHVIQQDSSDLYLSLRKLQGKKVRLQFRLPEARTDSSLILVQQYDLVTDR